MIKKVIEKEYPGATIGTLEQTGTEKYGGGDRWVICVKGYYYPKDEYGQVKSKKLFEKYYNVHSFMKAIHEVDSSGFYLRNIAWPD